MVEEANKKNAAWVKDNRATFIHSDIVSLPCADQSFNKIFTVNTIYFWENAGKVLGEIKRLLQPNGRLLIALRPKHQMEHYPFTRYGFNMYSKQEVEALLNGNGFHVTDILEHLEPDFDLNGEILRMENLVVVAHKK
jgi:ubiquinone/menaquinone biosynthesis C-methylase UbiE